MDMTLGSPAHRTTQPGDEPMKSALKYLSMAAIVVAAAPLSAQESRATKDIVETAVAAGSFKTLIAAVEAAGLVETLKAKGPFTVFAPTDEAFAKVPAGTGEALPTDKANLAAIPPDPLL